MYIHARSRVEQSQVMHSSVATETASSNSLFECELRPPSSSEQRQVALKRRLNGVFERQAAPEWRLDSHLERQVAPKRSLSSHLERQVAPKWRLSSHLERQVAPKRHLSSHLERQVAPKQRKYGIYSFRAQQKPKAPGKPVGIRCLPQNYLCLLYTSPSPRN